MPDMSDPLTHSNSDAIPENDFHVILRLRPLNTKQREDEFTCLRAHKGTIVLSNNFQTNQTKEEKKNTKLYTFENIVQGDQEDLYFSLMVKKIYADLFRGIHHVFIVYGAENTGKTFSLIGGNFFNEEAGLVARYLEDIFEEVYRLQDRIGVPKIDVNVSVQCLKIKDEQLLDVFADDKKKKKLSIKKDQYGRIQVTNLSEKEIKCPRDFYQLWKSAAVTKDTKCHIVLYFNIERIETFVKTKLGQIYSIDDPDYISGKVQGKINQRIVQSTLSFFDLRSIPKAFQRYKSGWSAPDSIPQVTDRSLLQFAAVIKALAAKPNGYIPYRESCVTRLLESYLGGNSKGHLICTLGQTLDDFLQNYDVLQLATKAKKITNHASPELQTNHADSRRSFRKFSDKRSSEPLNVHKVGSASPSTKYETFMDPQPGKESSKMDNSNNRSYSPVMKHQQSISPSMQKQLKKKSENKRQLLQVIKQQSEAISVLNTKLQEQDTLIASLSEDKLKLLNEIKRKNESIENLTNKVVQVQNLQSNVFQTLNARKQSLQVENDEFKRQIIALTNTLEMYQRGTHAKRSKKRSKSSKRPWN